MKPLPRKWPTLFALAGDSTMTSLPVARRVRVLELLADFEVVFLLGAFLLAVFFVVDDEERAAVFRVLDLVEVFLLPVAALVLATGSGRVKPSCAGVAPNLVSFVPQTAHVPLVIGLPLLANVACGSIISRCVLQRTQ
ncbi:MAG: hypothetical protein U0452_00090 [Anaerolineae bacterium]